MHAYTNIIVANVNPFLLEHANVKKVTFKVDGHKFSDDISCDFANEDTIQQYLSYLTMSNLGQPSDGPGYFINTDPIFTKELCAERFALFGMDFQHGGLAEVPIGRLSIEVTIQKMLCTTNNCVYLGGV